MPDEQTETEQVREFTDWIREHARGSLNDEMTAAMADVVLAVSTLEKPGTVTLKIKVEPIGTGERTVVTSGQVTASPPQPAPPASVFYPDAAGGLHRNDPQRPSLFDKPKGDPQP